MPDARMLQWPAPVHPAIGGGGRVPRKVLAWRGAVALGLILLLGVAKFVVAANETAPDPLSALPGGGSVTVGLGIGGVPTDSDLQALAESYGVDGVVSLSGPNVAEQVTVASLHLGYLVFAVVPRTALTWVQLRTLADFMRSHTSGGDSVYLHDDAGGGRVVAAADMLLLLRGMAWPAVAQGMTTGERQSLSNGQLRAIKQLISALHPGFHSSPGNPYADARLDPW